MTHRMGAAYSEAFLTFLRCTDEKTILSEALGCRLDELGVSSVLDIGAGNGDLSVPLAKKVRRYVAVEQKGDFVRPLSEAGIEVIQASYPCEIAEHFDAILISHSLPYHPDGPQGWRSFIAAAWSQLNGGGHLLIVTFEDEESEWNELLVHAGLSQSGQCASRLDPVRSHLKSLGILKQDILISHVRTDSLDEMMQALVFVYSDGDPVHMDTFLGNVRVREYLQAHHRTDTGYSFPFRHYLLDAN